MNKSNLPFLFFLFLSLFSNNLNAQKQIIQVFNLEHINTPELEFSLVQYHQGLVYVSSEYRHGRKDNKIKENTFDLLYADMGPGGKLSKPGPFSLKINTEYHEGPVSFSSDMKTMFYTRNNLKDGKGIKDKTGVIRMKIYTAQKGVDDWENTKELPFNSDQYSCVHPSISSDGKRLYFASDRPGGYGGMDIYYVEKSKGFWFEPVNLGPIVNSSGHDAFPFIHPSGKLFFSSNRAGGIGGYDLYMADTDSKSPANIQRLEAPLNSSADDLGIILNIEGTIAYFASSRTGGKGKDDLYRADIPGGLKGLYPPKDINLMVRVINKETGEWLENVKVNLQENQPNETIFSLKDIFQVNLIEVENDDILIRYVVKDNFFNKALYQTQADGTTVVKVKENKTYVIAAQRKGFINGYNTLTTLNRSEELPILEIALWPVPEHVPAPEPTIITIGTVFILDQIFYDFDKSYIRTDASKGLDAILQLMLQYPDMTIELTSHTDNRGTTAYNLDLSGRRSASAKYYLTSRGVSEQRIKAFGKGESEPRNHCKDGVRCSETEHQYNRRTEIKVTSLGADTQQIEYINNAPEYIDRAGKRE